MMNNFTSPQEFIEELKSALANPARFGVGDSGFLKITNKQIRTNFPEAADSIIKQNRAYDVHIEELKNDIFTIMTSDMREVINSNVAIGALDTGEANAIIVKSLDWKFAILINYGLMTLLNKYLKLTCAKANPRLVIYCNRKEANKLSSADLQQYLEELIENYKLYSGPYGPMIKLAESDQGMATVGLHLYFAELFIICHELGHYWNGDLNNVANFSVYRNFNWVHKFTGTLGHQKEHRADLTGYGLLQKIVNKKTPQLPRHVSLQSIVLLCTLLSLIYGDEPSYSHPSPTDRVLYIAKNYYGHDFAENLRRGYEQPELLDSLWKMND